MRPKKIGEKKTEPITVKATPSLKAKIQAIADSEDRTLSQTALFLMERGLADYENDGLLVPASGGNKPNEIAPVRAPIRRVLTDETKRSKQDKRVVG